MRFKTEQSYVLPTPKDCTKPQIPNLPETERQLSLFHHIPQPHKRYTYIEFRIVEAS